MNSQKWFEHPDEIFKKIKNKSVTETRIGRIINLLLRILFKLVLAAKSVRTALQSLPGSVHFKEKKYFVPFALPARGLSPTDLTKTVFISAERYFLGDRNKTIEECFRQPSSGFVSVKRNELDELKISSLCGFYSKIIVGCTVEGWQINLLLRGAQFAGIPLVFDLLSAKEAASSAAEFKLFCRKVQSLLRIAPTFVSVLESEQDPICLWYLSPKMPVVTTAGPKRKHTGAILILTLGPLNPHESLWLQQNFANAVTKDLWTHEKDEFGQYRFKEAPETWVARADALFFSATNQSDPILKNWELLALRLGCQILYENPPAKPQVFATSLQPVTPKKKTKIAVVNIFFAPISFGGATIVAEMLSNSLASDHDFEIAVFAGNEDFQLFDYQVATRNLDSGGQLYSVRLPRSMEPTEHWNNPKMGALFEEFLDLTQPDFIHFHCVQILGANLLKVANLKKMPFGVTLHDAWWLCDLQFRFDNTTGERCKTLECSPSSCSLCGSDFLGRSLRRRYLLSCMELADRIWAPSFFQQKLYEANGLNPSKISLNENGVLFPKILRKRTPRKNQTHLHFAFFGGPSRIKGFDYIKDVFVNHLAQDNYSLILPDPDRKRGGNSDFGAIKSCRGEVRVVDPFSQQEMDSFFNDIDILMVPSQWDEAFGLVLREAMIRDIFVICSDRGGLPEAVRHGVNGLIFGVGNTKEFVDHVQWCLANPTFFDNYINPFKEQIRSYGDQASELSEQIRTLIKVQK